jgi:hypothetical protein
VDVALTLRGNRTLQTASPARVDRYTSLLGILCPTDVSGVQCLRGEGCSIHVTPQLRFVSRPADQLLHRWIELVDWGLDDSADNQSTNVHLV